MYEELLFINFIIVNEVDELHNSVALVRERTILTERLPPVSEVSANFFADRGVSRGQRNGSPRTLISVFWTGAATFFIQVAPQLTSRG